MIHDSFFPPYPLQPILNCIREYVHGERIVIRRIYAAQNRRNATKARVWLFDCDLYNEGVPSKITIVRCNDFVCMTTARVIPLMGMYYLHGDLDGGETFDLDGKSFWLGSIITRFPKLLRAEYTFIGVRTYDLKDDDDTVIRVDDANFRALISSTRPDYLTGGLRADQDKFYGWAYEIDLVKNKAVHVISLSGRTQYLTPWWRRLLAAIEYRISIGKQYGRRIWKNRRILRHPFWRTRRF